MGATTKVQTTLRIDKEILEITKNMAKAANRSLNNYIECLLINNAQEEDDHEFWNKLEKSEAKIKAGECSSMKEEENLSDFLRRFKQEKGL